MKRAALICLCLCGCSSTPMMTNETIEQHCAQTPFEHYATCLESGMDQFTPGWRTQRDAAIWTLYLSWAKQAGALVASGKITDLEARTAALGFRAKIAEISSNMYWEPGAASLQMQYLALPDFSRGGSTGRPSLSCTSVNLGDGIADIQCH